MPLHPQVREFLDSLQASNAPGWDELTPEAGRELFSSLKSLFGTRPDVPRVENRTLAGGVPIRIYAPDAGAKVPIVMYFHGGGWVLGDLDTHDALCRRLCVESSSLVVSVGYRLAPEHRYPAALGDCFAATKYVAEHAAEWGGDASRLVVAGDSAGGNLAAAVALRARDQGDPALHAQVLIYPALDPSCDSPSYREYARGYGLTRSAMVWFWRQYLGNRAEFVDVHAAPVRAATLSGLPPAHVVTAEFDVLRDEGEGFAASLSTAGVPTTLRRYDGMIHGFLHFSGAFEVGKQAVKDLAELLAKVTRGREHPSRGRRQHEPLPIH